MECCTSNIASLHQEKKDPPSKKRVGGFEVVTYSCTRVIRPQALETHQETYTTTTTTVSGVVEWLSQDPIGISGGLNQYVAFGNNPVMFIDPLGLCDHSREDVEGILSDIRKHLDMAGFLTTMPMVLKLHEAIMMHHMPGTHDYKIKARNQTWDVPGFDRPLQSDEFGNFLAGYSSGYLGYGTYWGVRVGGILHAGAAQLVDRITGFPSGETWRDEGSLPMIQAGNAAGRAYKVERYQQYKARTPYLKRLIESSLIVF